MGLEKIKQEILNKAETTERFILSEASKQVEEIKNKADDKAKQLEDEASQNLKLELNSIEKREQSLVNMESQKMLFEAKKEMMDLVYNEAFTRINNMPKKDKKDMIKKLLEKAKKEIDVAVVYVNEKDKTLVDPSFQVKTLDIEGGIICENKDGTMRVDYSFDTLFSELRDKTIKETSNRLFG